MKRYIQHNALHLTAVWRLVFILGGFMLLFNGEALATHIVGGNLTYRCIGPDANGINQYEIRLTVRRDCLQGADNAPFDNPASVGIFDAKTFQLLTFFGGLTPGELRIPLNNNDTLNEILHSDCSVVAGDVCVHTTTYLDTIALPFRANGYLFVYQRCCRNGSINNIVDPLLSGMTLTAELSGFAQQQCNSSPQFNQFPPIYVCVGKEIQFDHSATDPEGDSLVYSLCTPFTGADIVFNQPQPPNSGPYEPLVYRPPYSLSNVMGGVPLTINPSTGALHGVPNTIGQFVVGLCVTAYKDGQLTGITRRDFQFNVRQCRDVPEASYAAPILTCDNLSVSFVSTSTLADEFLWVFNYPDMSATSTQQNPTYTFPQPGFYDVALIVMDSNHFCSDTLIQNIGVFNDDINADFSVVATDCSEGNYHLQVTDLTSSNLGFIPVEWNWLMTLNNGNIYASTEQNPVFSPEFVDSATALLALQVKLDNGCEGTIAKSFPLYTLALNFKPGADSICHGDTTHLLLGGNCGLNYMWEPPNGLDLSMPCDPIAYPGISTSYYVTLTDGICTISDSIHVNVQQLPSLDFGYSTDCKSLVVSFDNNSTNGVLYHWDFGDMSGSDEESPTHTYNQSGNYTIVLSSRDGCDVNIDTTITANAITETLDDQVVNCFMDSIALNPDHNDIYTYTWSPAGFLNDASSSNPMAGGLIDDTEFIVTITQVGLEGCEIYDTILVVIPDDFNIAAQGDTNVCTFDPVLLTSEVSGAITADSVTWLNLDGLPIGHGLSVIVTPSVTSLYYVVAKDTLGCIKEDSVTVFKAVPFEIQVGLSTDSVAYCDIQTVSMCADSLTGVTYEWFSQDDQLIGTGSCVDVTPATTTCFRVIGTDTLGCQGSEVVCLFPTTFNLDITGDQTICIEDQATLTVTSGNVQNLNYVWTPTVVSGQGSPSVVVDPDQTTTYQVVVTNTDVGCKDTLTSTVTVGVFDPPVVIVTADPDTITITDQTQLEVNQDPDYDYMWSSSLGDTPDPVYNPVVNPTESVTYTVTVTNEDGCTAVASVTITVRNPFCDDRDVFLPNAFTPNGDGTNDVLLVRSPYDLVMELHIYNRWGEEVFKTNDQNIGWDGRYKGKELPPDVFGYYLDVTCPGGGKFFKKGNVTLLR